MRVAADSYASTAAFSQATSQLAVADAAFRDASSVVAILREAGFFNWFEVKFIDPDPKAFLREYH